MLNVTISRPKDFHSLARLDMTGKPLFALLAIDSKSRQFGNASLLDFGDDEMMPRTIEATPRRGCEALHCCYDRPLDYTRAARDGGEIGFTCGGRFQSAAAFVGLV